MRNTGRMVSLLKRSSSRYRLNAIRDQSAARTHMTGGFTTDRAADAASIGSHEEAETHSADLRLWASGSGAFRVHARAMRCLRLSRVCLRGVIPAWRPRHGADHMNREPTISCLRCGQVTTRDQAATRLNNANHLCCPQCGGDLLEWQMPDLSKPTGWAPEPEPPQ